MSSEICRTHDCQNVISKSSTAKMKEYKTTLYTSNCQCSNISWLQPTTKTIATGYKDLITNNLDHSRIIVFSDYFCSPKRIWMERGP